MTKNVSAADFPANKALQHYFDDLSGAPQVSLSSNTPAPARSALLAIHGEGVNQPIAQAKAQQITNHTTQKIALAERLLAQANCIEDIPLEPSAKPIAFTERSVQVEQANNKNVGDDKEKPIFADNNTIEVDHTARIRNTAISLKDSLPTRFAVLLCDIANMTVAIPLVELGGIHKISKLSTIAGQPSWSKGMLIKGDDKFTCIDASAWIQSDGKTRGATCIEYKYALQLGKTPYALCCNSISSTVDISKDEVTWRDNADTRRWLSGLLKQEMCALIDGAQMLQEVLE
jgi:purine-binding chemotaxis protein CheW